MLEKNIKQKIINYIIKNGGDGFSISAKLRRGVCDCLCITKNGQIFLVETKQPKEDLSKLQEYFFLIWNNKKVNCIKGYSLQMFKEECRKAGIEI